MNIYPFTTENIAGYIDNFDLKDKSLLTVGSSGDQVLNAILKCCRDITVIDINPYTKFYYYLKVAGILNFNLNEFKSFFRYKEYPNVFVDNEKVFSLDLYQKLKDLLARHPSLVALLKKQQVNGNILDSCRLTYKKDLLPCLFLGHSTSNTFSFDLSNM